MKNNFEQGGVVPLMLKGAGPHLLLFEPQSERGELLLGLSGRGVQPL